MAARKATIQDVARAAGVAPSTVSRVLNNHPSVTEPTRQKVMSAIAQLRYVPNSFAKSLRTNQSYLLGLIVPDISNPFYPELARGLQDTTSAEGYSVIIYNTDGRRVKEIEALDTLRHYVEGIVIFPQVVGPAEIARHFGKGRPMVICDARPLAHEAPVLRADDVRAAELATDHLISVGCRTIAFVGVPVNAYQARFAGYRSSLARAGIAYDPELEIDLAALSALDRGLREQPPAGHGSPSDRGLATAGRNHAALSALVREKGVDGMVCVNDVVALRVIRMLHEAGIRVPQDVAVVGFDNIQAATTSMPSLSTIDYNKYEMGREAARLLLDALQAKRPVATASFTLEPQLIVRESTLR